MAEPSPLTPPPVPLAVVEWLEAVYPDRFPEALDPDLLPALQRQAGRLEVVRLLRQHADRATNKAGGRPAIRTQSPF